MISTGYGGGGGAHGAEVRTAAEEAAAASCSTYLINDFKQLYFKCPVSGMARNCSRISEARGTLRHATRLLRGMCGAVIVTAVHGAWTTVLTIHIQLHRGK